MTALTPEQLRDSETVNRELAEMNALLARAGDIADTLSQRGYDVTMNLWSADRAGSTVKGRLQGNVAKASLRVAAPRP